MSAASPLGFWVMTIFLQYWRKAYTNESVQSIVKEGTAQHRLKWGCLEHDGSSGNGDDSDIASCDPK
jgi:hypothetical protein